MQSENINELAAALAKAQGAMRGAKKDSDNPFFKMKYADLSSVWEACREQLSANGLAVTQTLDHGNDGSIFLNTMLLHSSGQWIDSRIKVKPAKDDPQGVGSAITYMRRYALAAIAGVAPEDDDAETAMGRGASAKTNGDEIRMPERKDPRITKAQCREFWDKAKDAGLTEAQVRELLTKHGYKGTGEIPVSKFAEVCLAVGNNGNQSNKEAVNE